MHSLLCEILHTYWWNMRYNFTFSSRPLRGCEENLFSPTGENKLPKAKRNFSYRTDGVKDTFHKGYDGKKFLWWAKKFIICRPTSNSRFGAVGNSRAPKLELEVVFVKKPFLPLIRNYLLCVFILQRYKKYQ